MIYLFDKDEQLIKLIKKSAIKSIEERQTLTDTRYISDRLSVELKALSDEVLARVEYVAVPTKANPHLFSLYFLATHENEGNTTMLEGAQVGIEELRKGIVEDKKPRNKTARPVIEELLSGTNWSARYVAETASLNTNLYYVSVFEALQKVCEVWDLEMQFFVEVSGNRIAARYIDFKRKIGKKVGTRLVYGSNALKLVQQVERTNLITAAIGRGKGEEVSSAEENESGQAGYGRKIDFSDIVWTKGANPVDKPKGQKYVEIKEATARYGIKRPDGMYPKVGIVEIETDDKNELLRRTYEELKKLSRPQATFKADVAYLKNAEIGDTIRVVRKDWQLDYETRIIEIAWDRLSDKATSITVGDQLNVSESKKTLQSLSALDDTISETVGQAQTKLLDHLISADGFNTNWYRPSEPPLNKTKIGDIWYKPDPEHEGEKIMLIWDGENWVEVVRTVGTKAITEKIEALKAESARYEQEFMQGLQNATSNAEANAQAMREQLESQIADETQTIKDKQAQFEAGMSQDRTKLVDLTQKVGTLSSQQTADKQSLSREIASAKSSVASVASDLAAAKTSLNNAVAQANTKATSLEQSLSQARQTLEQQGRDLVTQASAQAELRTLTSEVKKLADGTRSTVTELSKTVNKATRDITSVTNRTKVVEDGLVGVNNRYTETTTKIHAQTGQITTLNAKTAQLESGLSGIKDKFENIKIGSRNYFSRYLNSYDTTKPPYGFRKISDTEPITFTIAEKDSSVDTVGCYLSLTKNGNNDVGGMQVLINNGAIKLSKKTVTGLPYLSIYPRNQATLDKLFNRYKIMVEIGNIATDWVPAEEDFRHELATYVRNAEEDSAELSRRIETVDGKAVDAKAYAQQTAEGFNSRIESLESYKNAEGTRAEQYLSASRTETAKQLSAERTAIANDYVAKSTYTEDARGNTLKLNEIKTIADTAKQSLATYQNTVDRKLTELTSTTQTLDGKINTANTKVDTVAGQIRTEISEVEGKIPTSVSHRNLIPNTFDSWSAYQSITSSTNWVTSLGTVKYGDVSIYAGSKVHLYVHVSANDIVFDPNVTNHTMAIQGRILDSQNTLTWTDWNLYHPFYNKWSSNLNTGINYRLIKLTATVTQEMYQHSKGFELQVRIDGVKTGNFHIKSLMVTTGDIFPENWSPAPEDINSELSSTKTLITQTAEGQTQLSNRLTTTQDKISTAETKINQLIGDISTKVSKTDYDRLTNRVSNAETTIRTQAGQIEQRLTSTQVESAITAKGYQTKAQVDSNVTGRGYQTKADVDNNIAGRGFATATTLENKVRETVEGYTREISRVEGLIPTETTGNILLASNVIVRNAHSSLLTLAEPIVKGKTYTVVQHWWKSGSTPSTGQPTYCIDSHMTDNGSAQYVALRYDSTIDSWTATFVSTVDVAKGTRIRFANTDYMRTPQGQGSWTFTTLVVGNIPLSSWQPHWSEQATVTALNAVKSTADEHTRTLTSLQNDTLKKAEVSITSDKIVLGVGKEINGRTFSTMIAQNSQYVDIIAEKLRVSGNMIVDGTITSKDLAAGSVTAAQILANAVTTEKLAANAVTADKLLADQALFNKLKANQAYLKTLFTTDAFAQTVKTIDLVADKITTGTLNGANVNLINLNASNITSGRLSANLISGGVLSALNGAMQVNLNQANITFNSSATIDFNSSWNAVRRKMGDVTGFLHFNAATAGGTYVGLGVTSHNEGVKSQDTARFAGIRVFRSNDTVDQLELYGDKIILGHAFSGSSITLRASQLDKNYDLLSWMQGVKKAIQSLSNIWRHANNVNWDFVNSNDLRRAVYDELNSFGWGNGL
ncbi:phage tail spike protein [Streptococcus hyointestinalis]|nr:phage tail spike protein [Streptococcus hyointestinalis]